MSVILTKVIPTRRYESHRLDVPQFASFRCGRYSLYLPKYDGSVTGRVRLIREYQRRGYKLEEIGFRACYATLTK